MKSFMSLLCILVWAVACAQPVQDTSYNYKPASPDGTGKFYMGREIAHIMNASGCDWLERPTRSEEENTNLSIANMHLSPNSVVADIGAGTGFYTFRIARLVPKGKVYAVELQDELIKYLSNKKNQSHTGNIEIIKGDTLRVNLPDSSVDLAFMVDVYHELSYPKEIIRSISRSLKPSGKILLIEYKGEDPSVRIKPLHKTTIAQLSREMNVSGFTLDRSVDFLPIQHFLVFKRK
jgi:precorrin-6B methylase 2